MTFHLTNEETQVQEFKLLAQIYVINKLQNMNLNTILSIMQCNGYAFRLCGV